MATLHLVTGYQGTAHITSEDHGLLNAGCVGLGEYVLNIGKRFEAQVITNNAVRIYGGTLLMQGRQINLESDAYLDASISNGTQSQSRNDLIVIRYVKDQTTGIESAIMAVIQGSPSDGTPVDPTYNKTSILNGAVIHDMPLYRVKLAGLTIEGVEPMFNVLAPLSDIQHSFYKQNLLINGDFRCNQRGTKTYDVSSTAKYTVDMWRAYQVKVKVLNEGVELTGKSTAEQGYFTQFIQLGKLETKNYTISAMVDGKICTYTLTPGGSAKEKNFGKFKISALTMSKWDNDLNDYNNKLKVNICPIGTNTITVAYVDVFEGDVAYPHRKEDFATALIRCEKYIKKKGYTSPIYSIYSPSAGSYAYEFVVCFDRMENRFNAYSNPPKVESYTWNYITKDGTVSSGENPTVAVYNITNESGVHTLRTAVGTLNMNENCCAVKGVYVVTCEPADA